MSNIYYQDKILIKESTKNLQDYSEFSTDFFEKILKVDISSISWPGSDFDSFSWRAKDIFYSHRDYGEVYLPKNISLKNKDQKYYIVQIDGELEVVTWPNELKSTENKAQKLEKVLVTSPEELAQVSSGFLQLIEQLGVNKTLSERFAHIKGNKIKKSSIENLVNQIIEKEDLAKTISGMVYQSASSPVAFFEDNEIIIKKFSLEEPSRDLYKNLLCELLEEHQYLITLDHKFTDADLCMAIDSLSKGQIKLSPVALAKGGLNAQWATAAQGCSEKGFLLLHIDLDSDNFNLLLLPIDKFENLLTHAKTCRLKIIKLG